MKLRVPRLLLVCCALIVSAVALCQDHVPGRVLVKFSQEVTPGKAQQILQSVGARLDRELPQIGVKVLSIPAKGNEAAVAHTLERRPDVEFAEPDWVAPFATTPNDPYLGSEWHLNKISAPSAWSLNVGAPSVIVAILDTGVDGSHPDLAERMVAGTNTFDNNADTSDVYGHGTAVAGTAAAAGNNSLGISGVTWNCKIMPVRVTDTSGYGYGSTIAAGLTWAADHGARVANASFAMTWSSTIQSAAQYFVSRGGVFTMSAGNNATFDSTANTPYIVTVSATDSSDALASWSNTGNDVDLAAPGVGIYTTDRGGGYSSWSGTSFSAPIVAGVAALVISANPSLTGAQVVTMLGQSADDRGAAGWDTQFGYGRVNAYRALQLAMGGAGDTMPPALAFVNPTDGATVSGSYAVQVTATDNVGLSSISLQVDGVTVAMSTSASLNFTWNTLAVNNGVHTLSAIATDTSNNSSTMQITANVSNVADSQPPTAAIVSPGSGSRVGNSLSVSASASDDVGVVRVELYVDGVLKATTTAAPYKFSLNSRKWTAGTHTLVCKAYDAANNVGISAAVSVTK